MAENFNLIFGSQAPTTASWSDADYQTGWNVVGSTPPTAEQFDALQNRSDKKSQELNNRLSPLEQKAQEQGRQAGTAYKVGAAVTVDGLPADWLLVCTTAGTSGTAAITLPNPLIDGATITDGTITWKLRKVATNGDLGYRQPSKAYTVGDIAYHASLPTGYCLECTTAGTTADTMLDCSANKLGDTITDGTVKWQVRKGVTLPYELPSYMETLLDDTDAATARATLGVPSTVTLSGDATGSATLDGSANITVPVTFTRTTGLTSLCPDGAAAHNCFYRGKDITADFTSGKMSTNIANGTFRGIFIGDYITVPMTVNGSSIGNVVWRVGECDYYYMSGWSNSSPHHVLMVPDDILNVARMNSTKTTKGGYIGSEMWTATLPLYTTAIINAFGSSHVLTHRELLTNAIDANIASMAGAGLTGAVKQDASSWYDVKANLFNEVMVYGTRVFSSSAFDVGNAKKQVVLFALNHAATVAGYRGNYFDRRWYWLRSVASSSSFCRAGGDGTALYDDGAFQGDWCGLRPYFLLC